MIASQMLRRTLDIAVLAVLEQGDSYGVEIGRRLREAGIEDAAIRAVYATLGRLEHDGCVTSFEVTPAVGKGSPHYYQLTDRGRQRLAELTVAWRAFEDAMDRLLPAE